MKGGRENTVTAILLACGMASCLFPFHAATAVSGIDSFELSPEQLFSATVTSVSKSSEKLMDAPAAIFVLTGEDIMRSGATSIPEALRMVPGVQVARTHGGGWAVSVRGFNSGLANKLLVLMDGREVYDQLFSGVYWDVQDTVLEDIERIEVIRGPGAALWGANAVNGVINIITKHARDTQGGLVSAIAGNQDRAIGTSRYGGKIGENAFYRAYAKYINRDEERTLADLGARDGQQAYRAGFRSDWEDGSQDSFTLQGDMVKDAVGQLRVSSLGVLTREHIRATGWNILGRWTREFEDDARLTVQGYVDYTFRDQLVLADQRTSFDLDGQYDFPQYGRHKTIVGARYRLTVGELIGNSATTTHPTRHDQLFSGFVQDKITLDTDHWYLTLGSKFEHNDYSGFEVQPNARLQWHIDEEQMAWASIARAVRTPSQLEHDLTIDFLLGVFGLLPNTDFDSEELIAYELGYRRQIASDLSFDVAAFYSDYDKLSAVSAVGAGPFVINTSIANGTTAETYGGEFVLDWRALENLHFIGTYSVLQMQLHGPAGAIDPEVAERQSPHHQFNMRAHWNMTDNLSLDTMLYYVDDLPDFRIEEYWRLDMGLGWQLSDGMQLRLVGQNLLAGTHREFTAIDDPFTPPAKIGHAFYGKLTWMF